MSRVPWLYSWGRTLHWDQRGSSVRRGVPSSVFQTSGCWGGGGGGGLRMDGDMKQLSMCTLSLCQLPLQWRIRKAMQATCSFTCDSMPHMRSVSYVVTRSVSTPKMLAAQRSPKNRTMQRLWLLQERVIRIKIIAIILVLILTNNPKPYLNPQTLIVILIILVVIVCNNDNKMCWS